MVSERDGNPFLEQAARVGYRLAGSAIRHGGRATWIADEYANRDGGWCRVSSTLGGDFGAGTAGVGLFLAHLADVTHEPRVRGAALDATRHALSRVDSLLVDSRFGWYDGALGVTVSATIVARLLGREDLDSEAEQCESRIVNAMRASSLPPGVGLFNGNAGVLAALLALQRTRRDTAPSDGARALASTVSTALVSAQRAAEESRSQPRAGLAVGNSGIALALLAMSEDDDPSANHAAAIALDAERRCFQPGHGWWCDSPHEWGSWDPDARVGSNCAWCAGAAGIGVARLLAYRISREPRFLAEGVAAIELVRDHLAFELAGTDASVCHGWAGHVELLLLASSLLSEPTHLAAARSAALEFLSPSRRGRPYESGLWPGASNPSVLHGLAGVGLTLLRLHDPDCALSAVLPPCFSDAVLNRRPMQ